MPKISLEDLRKKCINEVLVDSLFETQLNRNIRLGDSFRWVEEMWKGEDGILCSLKFPQDIEEIDKYQLHPGLIDSCFGAVVALVDVEVEETFIPFSIEKFCFYKKPDKNRLWAYATLRKSFDFSEEKIVGDIYLLDELGEPIADYIGLEGRKASEKALLKNLKNDLTGHVYEVAWKAKENLNQKPIDNLGDCLIFADQTKEAEKISRILNNNNINTTLVYSGVGYEYNKIEDKFFINLKNKEDYKKLLQKCLEQNKNFSSVLHLWSLDQKPLTNDFCDDILETQESGCLSMLYLTQSLIELKLRSKIYILTMETQFVDDSEKTVDFINSSLWGFGRSLQMEHPDFGVVLIDLDNTSFLPEVLNNIVFEIISPDKNAQIAWRNSKRYVARLKKLDIKNSLKKNNESLIIDSKGTYLISGGLGALGLKTAEWLTENGAKNIVLTSRGNKRPDDALHKLEEMGADVVVINADISDFKSTEILFDKISSMPQIKGIFHAAGVLEDALLESQNWESFTKVMSPKIAGAWNLHKLSIDMDLDFFVCFSSIVSIIGSAAQSNYSAANSFMDMFMHYRKKSNLKGVSLNWGPWMDEGMAANLSEADKRRIKEQGISSIETYDGFKTLEALLGIEENYQFGVFQVNWSKFGKHISPDNRFFEFFVKPEKQKSKRKSNLIKEIEEATLGERRFILFEYLHSLVAKVLGLSSSQTIESKQRLFDLGVDSLMAVELKNSIASDLQTTLTSTLIFDYPTLDSLFNYISNDILNFNLNKEQNQITDEKFDSDNINSSELENLSETEAENLLLKQIDDLDFLKK